MAKPISVFFYGSFMRADVMADSGVSPARLEVARLSGYDITLDPHANIFPDPFASVYGVLIQATHEQLNRMYGAAAVGVFLPEAVLVTVDDDRWIPALCFMPPSRNDQSPDQTYLDRLIEAAVMRDLPQDYIARLRKFKAS